MNKRQAKKQRKRALRPFKGLLRRAQQPNLITGVVSIRAVTGPSIEK